MLIGCCSCQAANEEISCAKDSKAVPNAAENKVPSIETGKTAVYPCFNITDWNGLPREALDTPLPVSVRGQVGWGFGQRGLKEALSACSRRMWWFCTNGQLNSTTTPPHLNSATILPHSPSSKEDEGDKIWCKGGKKVSKYQVRITNWREKKGEKEKKQPQREK